MTLNGKAIVASITATTHGEKANSAVRKALPQVLAVMVKNVLLLAYGMTIGYPTILIPGLSGQSKDDTFHLNEEQISWISSINMMCVPLGCFFSGIATQPIGRKKAMQIVNFPIIMCWLIFRFSNEVWHIYLALALTGLFGGLLEAPVLTYVAEITQPHLRGMLSATSSLAIILGVLLQFLLGTFLHWRTVASVSCAFPVISFCLLLFVPESPHWLIMKSKLEDARKSLAWLRGWTTIDEIEEEFQELCAHHCIEDSANMVLENNVNGVVTKQQMEKTPEKSACQSKLDNAKNFTKKSFLWPLSMVSFIYFLVHFSGSTTLQTYAVQIFATLQAPINKYYATILLGVAEFVGCIICVILVHYVGKRVMAFISITGTGICGIVIATYAYLIDVKYINIKNAGDQGSSNPDLEIYKWIPLVFLILLAFISHCGLRVLPWILIGEIYPKETRATGCGISGAVSYIFGFSANKVFLRMVGLLTLPGVYWFYGCMSVIGIIVLYFVLPETEGKTLQEITDHFSGVSKLDNKVRRKRKSIPQGNVNFAYDGKVAEINQNENVESRL